MKYLLLFLFYVYACLIGLVLMLFVYAWHFPSFKDMETPITIFKELLQFPKKWMKKNYIVK